MTKRRSTGPAREGVGPWKGVRDINDPYAVPPDYLRDASNVYIPDGKGGSGAYARPGFRKVIVLEPSPPETDALVRGQLVWMDHLSAGKAQSIGDDRSTQAHKFGRYWDRSADSAFSYSATGGRVGGGYLTALSADAFLEMRPFTSFSEAPLSGDLEAGEGPNQCSMISIHDLQGTTPVAAVPVQSFGLHSRIVVLPNLTVQAQRWNGSAWVAYTGATSTVTVPVTGAFTLETQAGATPTGYRVGGFVLTNLYTDDGPVLGTSAIRLIGSASNIVSTTLPIGARVHMPLGSRLYGWALIAPYGTAVRWYYDLAFAAAMPFTDGTVIGSSIGHAHSEVFGLDVSSNPQTITTNLTWGSTDRWRNVSSTTRTAYEGDEALTVDFSMGYLSPSTNRWIDPDTGLANGSPFVPTSDTVVRNTLYGAVADFYRVQLNVTRAPVELLAVGPFALVGARITQGRYVNDLAGITHLRVPWMFTGPKPAVTMNYLDPIGAPHHTYTLALKTADEAVLAGRMGQALPGYPGIVNTVSAWRGMLGYQLNPPTLRESDPGGRPWTVTALPQVGLQGDFSKLDAIGGLAAGDRWLHLDVAQAGLDVAYRTRTVPALTVPQRVPLVDLRVASSTVSTGAISVYDTSIDFNGSKDELISGIATRVLNWGDGSDPVTLAGGGSGHAVSHTYAAQGVDETITLTVTNALGLSATTTMVFSPLGTLTAGFTSAIDSDGDPTGKTADFTDASTLTLGTIVSRSWDFGDGGTSTATNPAHVYAAYATYTVVLTITDNLGRNATHSASVEITEPVIGGGGCGLTAAAQVATAGIQADDNAGGNPRFANYVSTTTLRTYVDSRTPYRALFNQRLYGNVSEVTLDTGTVFNGRPSKKWEMHGDFYGAYESEFSDDTGSGDDADFTNFLTTHVWTRSIFQVNQQLLDRCATIVDSGSGEQLIAIESSNSTYSAIILSGTHVYLQISTRLTTGASQTVRETVDLGTVSALLAKDWVELITYTEADEAGNTQKNAVWIGDACSLGGVSPTADRSNDSFPTSGGDTGRRLRRIYHYEYIDNTSVIFSDPKPAVLDNLIEIHRVARATNPFGVALT